MNQTDEELEKFLTLCNEVLEIAEELPPPAAEFAESVEAKVEGMKEWATDHNRVTEKMTKAAENMKEGAYKWLRRRG